MAEYVHVYNLDFSITCKVPFLGLNVDSEGYFYPRKTTVGSLRDPIDNVPPAVWYTAYSMEAIPIHK